MFAGENISLLSGFAVSLVSLLVLLNQPNLECPVGYGIRPILAETYSTADAALRSSLASRTVAAVLDAVLSVSGRANDTRA